MAGNKKGKGGKNRRRGKKLNLDRRELVTKGEHEEYGQVLKMLGHGRVETLCYDGETRLCHIRGKMRKKVWIVVGDIVLVSLREFQDERGDIIYKYLPDEARQLKALNEIPDNVQVNEDEEIVGADVQFGEVYGEPEDTDGSDDDDDDAANTIPIAPVTQKFTSLQPRASSDDEYGDEYEDE